MRQRRKEGGESGPRTFKADLAALVENRFDNLLHAG